jgi:hypothetical protein
MTTIWFIEYLFYVMTSILFTNVNNLSKVFMCSIKTNLFDMNKYAALLGISRITMSWILNQMHEKVIH